MDIPEPLLKDGRLKLSTGVTLECILKAPNPSSDPQTCSQLAICLHPWSWLGGQMNDPVLRSLDGVLKQAGYHVLRYNSRAVGRSTGRSSFTGFDEAKDLEAIVEWASENMPQLRDVALIGYSHGSLVASLHPPRKYQSSESESVNIRHILISYPLGPRSFLTLFRHSFYEKKLEELVQDPQSKVLILYGDRDEFTGVDRYKEWTARLKALPGTSEDRLGVVHVEGASHFWNDEESCDRLWASVFEWVSVST
ncbi:alpha/beta-hydrolase [Coprinopsis marcescibilis]|uniref:Alpha/beta-hydrolase n=1 Tax=Coprinopsis marcescibilis TaxID=230819 RepID=A0A5C3L6M4_COPMA|nr:alpha/beta-hydrolase [Coprinopsis marcescibilis]